MQTIKDVEINALRRNQLIQKNTGEPEHYMPYTYLMSEDLDKLTQSHDDERCYEAMTTNISECFNGVLKGARDLPIAAMVEFTWYKLLHISMIDVKKLLLISLKVRCGVIMPWGSMAQMFVKLQDTL